jgi:hypothetical protein
MTKIDFNSCLQEGRYHASGDYALLHEEQIAVFNALKKNNFQSIEEEWAFRNGFIERKQHGQEFLRVLHKDGILIGNYKCQGRQKGMYRVEFDDELKLEEEPLIEKTMKKYKYTTTQEKWAFRQGFIARRKFGTRHLDIQKHRNEMLVIDNNNQN